MASVNVNGINLYYQSAGDGVPLVFVPGLGGTVELWYRQLGFFAAHYRCLSLDNRGAGRSDKPAGPYSAALFASDLNGLLDALAIDEPVHLVGASMGGIIAQAFIHAYPQRVRSMTLACTGIPPGNPQHVPASEDVRQRITHPGESPEEKIDSMLALFYHPDFVAAHPEVRDFYLTRKAEPQPAHAYQAQLDACFSPGPYYRWLADVQVPALILHGRDDLVWPLQNAYTLQKALGTRARLEILPGAAHILMQEQPDEFNSRLLDFLQNTEA